MDTNLPIVPEAIESVNQSTANYFLRHPWYIVIGLALPIGLETFVIMDSPRGSFSFFNIVPLFIPYIWYWMVHALIQHEFMAQFAAANGFQYAKRGTMAGLDGTVFNIGDGKSVADVITGTYGSYPISLFTYTYGVGHGKSRTTYSFDVFELQFDTAMPDLFLLQKDRMFGNFFSSRETLKLEGDFDKYFTLSIAKGYEVEALEIFSPEIMAALIDKARSMSMEIVNNHVFIYAANPLSTKEGLYAMYNLAQYFTTTLGPVLSRMKPTLTAEAAYLQK